MTFETKEQVLEKIMTMEKPSCPHCGEEMSIWEVPPINVGDGLGWGSPYLFMCFNDECPYYVKGWTHMEQNYNQKASYRHRYNPESGESGPLPVWSAKAHRDRLVEEEEDN